MAAFLVDEDMAVQVAEELRESRHDAFAVEEIDPGILIIPQRYYLSPATIARYLSVFVEMARPTNNQLYELQREGNTTQTYTWRRLHRP